MKTQAATAGVSLKVFSPFSEAVCDVVWPSFDVDNGGGAERLSGPYSS